jgi:hypothetical protein
LRTGSVTAFFVFLDGAGRDDFVALTGASFFAGFPAGGAGLRTGTLALTLAAAAFF